MDEGGVVIDDVVGEAVSAGETGVVGAATGARTASIEVVMGAGMLGRDLVVMLIKVLGCLAARTRTAGFDS